METQQCLALSSCLFLDSFQLRTWALIYSLPCIPSACVCIVTDKSVKVQLGLLYSLPSLIMNNSQFMT